MDILKIDIHEHLAMAAVDMGGGMKVSSYGDMLPHLKELGIGKAVLMSSGEEAAPFGNNEVNRQIVKADPVHYAWMCNFDMGAPEEIYDKMKEFKAQGAVGVGELMQNIPADDPFICAIFAAAGKLGMPVTFHMSPQVGVSYGIVDEPRLPRLEKMLRTYSDTIFVGHSQCFWIEMSGDAPDDNEGRNSWGQGPVIPGGRVPELFEKYPNLYGDLSANSAGQAIMRDPEFGLAFLEKYSDRLLFATDMANTEMVFPLGAWLDAMAEAGKLSREAYKKICFRNAQRIYGL